MKRSRVRASVPATVTGAVATVGLAAALLLGGAFDAGAESPEAPASGPASGSEETRAGDGTAPSESVTVVAAYVAPAELVVRAGDGAPRTLPVAEDVAVTVDGRRVDYAKFTRSFEDGAGEAGGAGLYRLTTAADGTVVRIDR